MKSLRVLFTDVNYIFRLLEWVLCLLGIIYYHHILDTLQLLILHGWFFVSLSYILSYIWEDPDPWVVGGIRDWSLYYIDDSYHLHRLNGALHFADNSSHSSNR
ncbi:hypothetical protein V1478_003570 [Vespula squamosa]|uniref:Uncharacterized protein n=1 Tax=Vespula squamosa TaxID=30214 RepID=A0ABD2BM66_VESSQ